MFRKQKKSADFETELESYLSFFENKAATVLGKGQTAEGLAKTASGISSALGTMSMTGAVINVGGKQLEQKAKQKGGKKTEIDHIISAINGYLTQPVTNIQEALEALQKQLDAISPEALGKRSIFGFDPSTLTQLNGLKALLVERMATRNTIREQATVTRVSKMLSELHKKLDAASQQVSQLSNDLTKKYDRTKSQAEAAQKVLVTEYTSKIDTLVALQQAVTSLDINTSTGLLSLQNAVNTAANNPHLKGEGEASTLITTLKEAVDKEIRDLPKIRDVLALENKVDSHNSNI